MLHLSDSLRQASPALWVLVMLSIITLGIGLERLSMALRWRRRLPEVRQAVLEHLEDTGLTQQLPRTLKSTLDPHPAGALLAQPLTPGQLHPAQLQRGLARVMRQARRRQWILGSVGSLAPFIGLLGTVLGVMEAFVAMGREAGGGFSVVSQGISEALVTTAAGIFVGIEAVIFFNVLQVVLGHYAAELKEALEEIFEARTGQKKS